MAVYSVNAKTGELECHEEPTLEEIIARERERRRRDPAYDKQQRAYSTFGAGPSAPGYAEAKAFLDKEAADATAHDIECALHNWRVAVKEGQRDCILWPSREKIQARESWPGVEPEEWAAFRCAAVEWLDPWKTPEALAADTQHDYERAVESLSDPKTIDTRLLARVHDPENVAKLVAQMSPAKVAYLLKAGRRLRSMKRPELWASVWHPLLKARIDAANDDYQRKLAAHPDVDAIAGAVAKMSSRKALRVLRHGLSEVKPELKGTWIQMLHAKIAEQPTQHPSSPTGHGFKWSYEQRGKRDLAWIIAELMIAGTWGLVTAPTRAGKTFLCIHLALCTWFGRAFFGREIRRRGGTLIIAAEAAYSIPHRIDAALMHGFESEEPPAIAFDGPPPNLLNAQSLAMYIARLKELAQDMQARHKVPLQLIIVDTFSKAFPGLNEDKASECVLAHNALEQIAQALNVAVVVAAHTGKDGSKGTRGSASHEQNAHFVLKVPSGGTLHLAKQKEASDDLMLGRFEMPLIDLGVDGNGKPVTSRAITEVEAGSTPMPFGDVATPEETNLAQKIFRMAFAEASPDGTTAPIGTIKTKFGEAYPRGAAANDKQANANVRQAWRRALKRLPSGFAIEGENVRVIV